MAGQARGCPAPILPCPLAPSRHSRGLSSPALGHLQSQPHRCSFEGWERITTGLKASLPEKAMSGRQHKMEMNPFKDTNHRARQSLGSWEDVGVVKQGWRGCGNSFPAAWGFVVGCPEFFPAKPLCLKYFGCLCPGVIVISLWFYHHLIKSGIPFGFLGSCLSACSAS